MFSPKAIPLYPKTQALQTRRNSFLWINIITLLYMSLRYADFEFLISILFLYDQKISLLEKLYQTVNHIH